MNPFDPQGIFFFIEVPEVLQNSCIILNHNIFQLYISIEEREMNLRPLDKGSQGFQGRERKRNQITFSFQIWRDLELKKLRDLIP